MKFNQAVNETRSTPDLSAGHEALDAGDLYIEFAKIKKKKQFHFPVIVKSSGYIRSVMGQGFDGKYKDVQHLKKRVMQSIRDSFGFTGEGGRPKKTQKYYIDDKDIEKMFNSVIEYADFYDTKSKSLTYDKSHALKGEKNPSWDLHIKFRRDAMGKVVPQLSGGKGMGKLVGTDEIEVKDKSIHKLY